MTLDKLIESLNEDELWIVREALGFFIDIARDREADGLYVAGTTKQAEDVAQKLGLEVSS